MKSVILVIDMINDFVSGVLGSKRAEKIVPNIRKFLSYARDEGLPVIYVTDAHLPQDDHEFDIWPSHAVEGTEGAKIIDALQPEEGDFHIKKRRYSGFYATGLEALLRELGIDTVVLTGLVTNICIQHTAADAFFRGYRVVIPRDCVEAPTDEAQKRSLSYMEQMYGVDITSSEDIIEERRLMEGGTS